jgi:hypothetical protein
MEAIDTGSLEDCEWRQIAQQGEWIVGLEGAQVFDAPRSLEAGSQRGGDAGSGW